MGRLLSKGNTGLDVTELQAALNFHVRAPATPLVPDGIFGPLTDARLREFQRLAQIHADGIAGPVTIGMLYRAHGGVVEALLVPYKIEAHQAFFRGRIPAGLGPRLAPFGAPGMRQLGPAGPSASPPKQPVPQTRAVVSAGFEIENKFVLGGQSKTEFKHTVKLTLSPKIPWPVLLPDPLKLEVAASTPGPNQYQLSGKIKMPFKLDKGGRLELAPYFSVGSGMKQGNYRDLNLGGGASLKLKLLDNIGGQGPSLSLSADGALKSNHVFEAGEHTSKGIFQQNLSIQLMF
ncbi:peptidoglycan-binding domain-containing protein [Luteimonas salinilitoris]|uniref:Peptidoglycan-binding protein n=1 Tax=Luteimonas salinilitoris TaxID=3237697 RepID=A0ABV4HSF3_9GAMM